MTKILSIVKTFLERKSSLAKSGKEKGGPLVEAALLHCSSLSKELSCER
jgi:hypothetical protein